MLFAIARGYNALLAKYPCTTKTVTAGALAAAGDVCVQVYSEGDDEGQLLLESNGVRDDLLVGGVPRGASVVDDHGGAARRSARADVCPEFDVRRFVGFTIFGSIWSGYLNHYWFDWLARTFAHHRPVKALACKTLCQHGILNPFFYIPAFFLSQGVWMDKSWEETKETTVRSYWPTLSSCWVFWIPATSAQFLFVPLRYQVLYGSTLSFLWNVFLAFQD